jgi:pyridoxal 5'-phosphate synthase pdxT subunit
LAVSRPPIGVLALQGDVREHLRLLTSLGVEAVAVRRETELAGVAGLVLPGGESTTMVRLARTFELIEPLRARIRDGMPAFGTCAGMILLADRVLDGIAGQETLGGLDITVRRNAFGRQVDSFEEEIHMTGVEGPVHAVFIRAPWVESVADDVEVLATVETGHDTGHDAGGHAGRIVAVRQGPLMATSFHPEMGGGSRIHRMFVDLVAQHTQS